MAYTDPRPGPAGTIAGLSLGFLFFVAMMFGPLFVWAWSGAHCTPQPACGASGSHYLLKSALLALGPAALFGVAVRSLFHWLGRKIGGQEPGAGADAAGPTPWWALVAAPLALWAGSWLVWI